jgi:hypothetical protein
MKFLNFFLFLWVIFSLLDTDPDPDFEYKSGSGSTDLIESVSNPDPNTDPKHCRRHTGRPIKSDNLLTGEGGRKLGRSKSYDGEKATHLYLILSAFSLISVLT